MSTYIKDKIVLLGIIVMLFATAFLLISFQAQRVEGSAPSGLPSTVATTTNPTVSTTAVAIFATSTCAARVITTSVSAIMLTFSDYKNDTPTGSFGHLQAASTTVAYDSGQYGCGLVKAYSFGTQVITVMESR